MTTSDLPTGTPAGHREIDEDLEPPREPNYLLRRAIVIGSVVALIAAIAIGVGALLDRDSDSATSAGAPAEWDTVVLLDRRSGQVILTDTSGEESARFTSGVRSPTDAIAVGPTLVVTSAAAAGVVDLGTETSQVFDFATAPDGAVMPAGSAATLLVGSSAGDRAVLVHGPSGDLIDTDASVPIAGAAYDVATAVASPSGPRGPAHRLRQFPERAVLVRSRSAVVLPRSRARCRRLTRGDDAERRHRIDPQCVRPRRRDGHRRPHRVGARPA